MLDLQGMLEGSVRGDSSEANHTPTSMCKFYSLKTRQDLKELMLTPSWPSCCLSECQVPCSCLAGCPACGGRLSPHLSTIFGDKQDNRGKQWDLD